MKNDSNEILKAKGRTALRGQLKKAVKKTQKKVSPGSQKASEVSKNKDLLNSPNKEENPVAVRILNARADLQIVEQQIADFESQKSSASEKLNNIGDFSGESAFQPSTIECAAFAKKYQPSQFQSFIRKLKEYNECAKDHSGTNLTAWNKAVKEKEAEISARFSSLTNQAEILRQSITTLELQKENELLAGLSVPNNFFLSENGVFHRNAKVEWEQISRQAVMVSQKYFGADTGIFMWQLSFKDNGRWYNTPPVEQVMLADRQKLVQLSKYGLQVNSKNALAIIDFFDAVIATNSGKFPTIYTYEKFGWKEYDGREFFLDPRLNREITIDNQQIKVECTSQSQFAKSLHSKGDFEKWLAVCREVKKYSVARLILVSCIAAPLLKILNQRAFLLHVYSKTTSGKTTALKFGASAVGNFEGIVKNFNATQNGLQGTAAEFSDYSMPIDEWQVAGNQLKENIGRLIHVVIDGTSRTKMNKDSTVRSNENWRVIVITTGETPILADNALGGEHTRVLNINAPAPILPKDLCSEIYETIGSNYGFAFQRFISAVEKIDKNDLAIAYKVIVEKLTQEFSSLLDEHCRYLALLTLADCIFFGTAVEKIEYQTILSDSLSNIRAVAEYVPNKEETADTPREIDMLTDFIGKNQKCFFGATPAALENINSLYGKFDEEYVFITVSALKIACKENGFDYKKVVADLIADNFFVPADATEKGRKKPLDTVKARIGETNPRCYRIPRKLLDSED